MTRTTPTRLWNDSADPRELRPRSAGARSERRRTPSSRSPRCGPTAAVAGAAPGAAAEHPTATESELGWLAVEELSVAAAALLEPAFRASGGRDGRLSIQTDPRLWRDPERLVAQAVHFDGLAPNVVVKIPATSAGIVAIEEVTARGISINATVSFTVPQALAVGEAVERGLRRREAAGHDVSSMGPVCTIMVGRLDDWMKVAADKAGVTLDPGYFEWAGVAAFKRAYQLYTERGYRVASPVRRVPQPHALEPARGRRRRHLAAFGWQRRLNASGIDAVPRIDEPVSPEVLNALYRQVGEFRRAYDPDGLAVAEFDTFGATRRTLRQFLTAAADLDALVRDVLLPDPDKERTAS